jgi:hypothetical protein
MQNLTPAQTDIINHMQACEIAFSGNFSEREAANLFDENNRIINSVTVNKLYLPTMSNNAILFSLDEYRKILSQHMPKFQRPGGPG